MRNWQNKYVVMVEYRRDTMSIYRIYFRTVERFEAWYVKLPLYYKVLKVEM